MRHNPKSPYHSARFDIIRPLGSGGFGAVYEAVDNDSRQRVALKELTRVSPNSLFRFKQEFRALSDVHHPNLVLIKELIEQDGRWYIVMELVQGVDLKAFVRTGRPGLGFDEDRLRDAFIGVARGLEALHEHGVLHRDLKPSNVLVTPEGRSVLLDFGLVTSVDSADQSTHAAGMGTARYMAPEQFLGDKLSPAADWYALGTCLYEALTDRPPYEGDSSLQVALDKQSRAPVDPNAFVLGLPEDLTTLCMALLQTSPELRPSGSHVLAVLHGTKAISDKTVVIPLSSPPARMFAGREAELEYLERALTRTDDGDLRIVLIEGESGVGKSELVAEFLRQHHSRDPRTVVLRGRCYENEQVSYKAFDGCIDELARILKHIGQDADALMPVDAGLLAQLFPVMGDVPAIAQARRGNTAADPTARRLQAFSALSALLSRLAEEHPLVLAIDDLQWADAESFRLLRALVEDPKRPPLLLLTTVRPRSELEPDVRAHLEAIRALECVDVIPIIGLPRPQAEELARLLLGPTAAPQSASIIAIESRGHPLFLSELIHFSRSQDIESSGTLTLDAAIEARIEPMGSQPRALLELVAIATRPFPAAIFAEALGASNLDAAMSALLGAKLLRMRRDQELSCYHDRIRRVTAQMIASARLPHLHRQLAEALERDPDADPTDQAAHWDQAHEPERAASAYEHAADQALGSLAFAHAERLYARALELLGTTHDARYTRLTVGRANALACSGRSAEAASLYQRAAELEVEEEARLRLRSKTAQHLVLSGDMPTGVAACRQLLKEIGITLPSSDIGAVLRFLWDRLWLRLKGGLPPISKPRANAGREQLVLDLLDALMKALAILRTSAYLALSGQHARRAVAARNPVHTALACANEAWLQNALGRTNAGARLFRLARELCDQTGHPAAKALLAQQEGSAYVANWDWPRGAERLQEAERLYQAHISQDPWSLTVTRYLLGISWYRLGEHALLAEKMDLWIGEARERLDRVAVALLSGIGHGSGRHLMRGSPHEALRELDDAVAAVPPEPFSFAHLGHMVGTQHALTVLGGRAALEWLQARQSQHKSPLLRLTRFGRETLYLLRSTATLRALEVAGPSEQRVLLEEVRTIVGWLRRQPSPFMQAFGKLLSAQCAAFEGQKERALEHARGARQGFAEIKYVGVHSARYLEGWLEGGQAGAEKCADALAYYGTQGWIEPEHALTLSLPVLPALVQQRATSRKAPKRVLQYELLGPLGGGRLGNIFEARDRESGQRVALKELVHTSERSLERFKHEFRALSGLHHPNLVRFDALFEHESAWYIAMELIEGEDLLSYVRPEGSLDPVRLRLAFSGLLAGVSALHEAGIVHRDISPDSVRVTPEGRAVLLDFGLIGHVQDGPEASARGTASHAAPEQLEGAAPHASADIYSLGALLCEALSGEQVCRAEVRGPSVGQMRGAQPTPAHPYLKALLDCALRMLEPRPLRRPTLAEVTAVVESAREPRPSCPAPNSILPDSATTPVFEGREAELSALSAAADRARTHFCLVLIEGATGIGKSALAAEFARRFEAERPSAIVLTSRCYESERLAFKAVDGVVDQLARVLRSMPLADCEALLTKKVALLMQLFPTLASVPAIFKASKKGLPADPASRRREGLDCLAELLSRLGLKQPLLMMIDDLQWAELEDLGFLNALSERSDLPLLVICTLQPRHERRPDLSPQIDALSELPAATTLTLEGLARHDAEELAASLLGDLATPALQKRLSAESRGHPLLLRELIEHAKSSETPISASGVTLDEAVHTRLARTEPEGRRLVALLALAKRPYSRHVLCTALGAAELPLDSLNDLLNRRLLRRRGADQLACYHDHVRRMALAHLTDGERRELSAKLAEALEHAPEGTPAERARLWEDTDHPERAILALEEAGNEALAKLAFEAADQHYARALSLSGQVRDARFRRLACQRGHALVRMGRNAQAAELYAAAAEGAEGAERVKRQVWAAQNLIQGARVAEGLQAAAQLLAELGVPLEATAGRAVARIVWESARLRLRGIDLRKPPEAEAEREGLVLDALSELNQSVANVMFLEGAALSAQYVRRALNAGKPAHAARALAHEGMLRSARSPRKDASALFERARELAKSSEQPAVLASVEVRHGIACLAREDLEGSIVSLLRGYEIVSQECPGQPFLLTMARTYLGAAWFLSGRHRPLSDHADGWVADARQREDRFGYVSLTGLGFGFVRHLMRDDPDAAQAELARAMEPWPDQPFSTQHAGAMLGTVFTLHYQGGGGDALAWFEKNDVRLREAAILRSRVFRLAVHSLRALACMAALPAWPSGGNHPLLVRAARDVRALQRMSSASSKALATLWSSMLKALRGDAEHALKDATAARTALRELHHFCGAFALYWEGWLEGEDAGRARRDQALSELRREGWTQPERAMGMILPAVRLGVPLRVR